MSSLRYWHLLAVTSDGWSKVKTGDIVGYVKTEYVTTQHP